jgi:hypothetical protein
MRFRSQRQKLQRPTLTPEQARLLELVDDAGSPKAAAEGLFRRLADLEARVAEAEAAAESDPAPESA